MLTISRLSPYKYVFTVLFTLQLVVSTATGRCIKDYNDLRFADVSDYDEENLQDGEQLATVEGFDSNVNTKTHLDTLFSRIQRIQRRLDALDESVSHEGETFKSSVPSFPTDFMDSGSFPANSDDDLLKVQYELSDAKSHSLVGSSVGSSIGSSVGSEFVWADLDKSEDVQEQGPLSGKKPVLDANEPVKNSLDNLLAEKARVRNDVDVSNSRVERRFDENSYQSKSEIVIDEIGEQRSRQQKRANLNASDVRREAQHSNPTVLNYLHAKFGYFASMIVVFSLTYVTVFTISIHCHWLISALSNKSNKKGFR